MGKNDLYNQLSKTPVACLCYLRWSDGPVGLGFDD